MISTQIMKPRDDAQKVEPTNVQSAAASQTPRNSTAIPPAIPSRPNQTGTFRAPSAASEEPMITVAALAAAGVEEKFSYVSTAGGAFLEWMEGKTLPGVAALVRAA